MIKIYIDIDKKIKYDFDIEKLTYKIAKKIFELEKLKFDYSFNLSFVKKNVIKKINKDERGINKETDVLSFPNIDFTKPACFKGFISKNEIDVSIVDLNTKTIFLGDVVICKEIMEMQSKLYEHSIKREFSFLLTHSIFHLLGYDHIDKNDEKIMFKKQDKVLETLKINR